MDCPRRTLVATVGRAYRPLVSTAGGRSMIDGVSINDGNSNGNNNKTERRRTRREGISNRNRRRILESIHVNLISTLTALFIIQIFPNAKAARGEKAAKKSRRKSLTLLNMLHSMFTLIGPARKRKKKGKTTNIRIPFQLFT